MTDGLPNPQRAFACLAVAIALTMTALDAAGLRRSIASRGAEG
jgi:hypothetical protein